MLNLIRWFPEVTRPTQKFVAFNEKLKWTGIVLIIFFVLNLVPLFGLWQNQLKQFELLSVLLGASFGSILSLGIGPIVTASIVLQLLNGSGLLKFDLTKPEGKKTFQGVQKLLTIFFVFFEAIVYVVMRGLAPSPELVGYKYLLVQIILIAQLALGGFLIILLDDLVSKWGFGSGVSLFIAAGVAQHLFIRLASPLPSPTNPELAVGALPAFFQSLAIGDAISALIMISRIVFTVIIFVIAVYAQSMKVELPLSFGVIGGQALRWPLAFLYTSNIPVILVAALFANIQLWATLLQNWGFPILGRFVGNTPVSGLVTLLTPPHIVQKIITGSLTFHDVLTGLVYLSIFILACILFSWLWVNTAGMDAASQAKHIMASGLSMPGFRRDERVLERVLSRYISALTVMGGAAIGILAGLADISGTLTSGTGLLLTVMIIYRFYEEIVKQHMVDMNPLLKRFIS